jgi:hypothetical protein
MVAGSGAPRQCGHVPILSAIASPRRHALAQRFAQRFAPRSLSVRAAPSV